MADKYGIQFVNYPLDNEAFKATPVPANAFFTIFGVPDKPNCSCEVLYVGVSWTQIPVDATDPITADLNFHDKSAASNTVLVTAFNFKSTNASLVVREVATVFTGNQRLDSGDSLNLLFATTTPDTAGLGGTITVGYRVKEWNGE